MQMGQSLSEAAVRGMFPDGIPVSDDQRFLESGDVEGLLAFHRAHFGETVMEDREDDEDEDGEEDESDEDESDDSEDEDEEGDESEDDAGPKDVRIQQLSAEAKKYRLKNRDHRNRISELEREIADLKRGKGKPKSKVQEDKDEDDPRDDERTSELEKQNQELAQRLEDNAIRLEFMANNQVRWKNPKAALRLLDLSDVEVDEDGTVVGLDEAIEKLAKDEPYLLDTSKEEKSKKSQRKQGSTGQPTKGKSGGNPNRDALLKKYPALRR